MFQINDDEWQMEEFVQVNTSIFEAQSLAILEQAQKRGQQYRRFQERYDALTAEIFLLMTARTTSS